VVWVPGEAVVHAAAEGVVEEVVGSPNATVRSGEELIRLDDPALPSRVRLLEARAAELEARRTMMELATPAEAKIAREELRQALADLELARQRQRDLTVRSLRAGELVLPRATNLVGRFVRKGDVLGYVTSFNEPVIRAAVPEDSADLVRKQTTAVGVRFVSDHNAIHSALIAREVPGLLASLPSGALSTTGGGQIALDPTDARRERVLGNLLHLDILLSTPSVSPRRIGERAYVRFAHAPEPLMKRWYFSLRQLFLRHFKLWLDTRRFNVLNSFTRSVPA
jgi:putative peptide zinc metalloprotease protein